MSETAVNSTPQHKDNEPSVRDSSHVAHHFSSEVQQHEAGKLGMWALLVSEVLFFGALFVAYAVYSSSHREIFEFGRQHLNATLGTLNTIVLLFSSLTMAFGVRAAKLGHHRILARSRPRAVARMRRWSSLMGRPNGDIGGATPASESGRRRPASTSLCASATSPAS